MKFRKEDWGSLLFLKVGIFLHRPAMLAALFRNRTEFLTTGLFVLLAGGLCCFSPKREKSVPIEVLASLWILFLSGLFHWLAGGMFSPDILGKGLACSVLPYFAWKNRDSLIRLFPPFALFLWILHCTICLIELKQKMPPLGITGNWNWSAVLTLTAGTAGMLCFRKKRSLCIAAGVIIGGLSLFLILTEYYSRGVFLALVLTGIAVLLLRLRKQRKMLLYLLSGVVAATLSVLLFCFPEWTAEQMSREIRTELTSEAISLIAARPLGTGICGFENAVIPFKTDAYHLHRDAAVRTVHPHNEILNVTATLGIPAGIAWCVLLGSILIRFYLRSDRGECSRAEKVLFFVWLFLMFTSLTDLTLYAWPLNWIGLILTGLMIPDAPLRKTLPDVSAVRIAAGCILLAVVGWFAWNNFLGTRDLDRAEQAYREGRRKEGLSLAARGLQRAVPDPEAVYFFSVRALTHGKDPAESMRLARMLETSLWPDFSHLHLLLGNLHALGGQDEKALAEYEKECRCFPCDPMPLAGKMHTLIRLNRKTEAEQCREALQKVLLLRNMTEDDLLRKFQSRREPSDG